MSLNRIQLLPSTKRGLDTIWHDYNQIEISDTAEEKQAKVEQWIAKKIGTALMTAYNQREWKVIVDTKGLMVIVGCDSICNYKGYHIKMEGCTIEELISKSIMAAGEILERHNVARTRNFNPAILEELARDRRDSVISPDAAPEPI